jgi:DNA-binding transcriptional regulator YiaG
MLKGKLFDSEGEPPVKQIRLLLGMSQLQFANLLGVYPSTVSRWESGKSEPQFTARGMKNLLEALKPHGIQLEDLPDQLGSQAGQV